MTPSHTSILQLVSAFEPLPVAGKAKPLRLRSDCTQSWHGEAEFHFCLAPVTALLCFHHLEPRVWGKQIT